MSTSPSAIKEILAVPLGTLARPGSTFDDPATYRPLEEAQPGGSDPVARLADMDSEGIDQAVLYPSIGLYAAAIADPVAAVAVARTYNDWLASYCTAAPRAALRLRDAPLCRIPLPPRTELRRAANRAGLPGRLRPAQPLPGPLPVGPGLRPALGRGRRLRVPIGIHEGSSVIVPTLGSDRPFNPLILHAVSHSFEEMLACAQLIALGTFERHPGLRCIFLESSAGGPPSGWSGSTSRPSPSGASAPT